MFWPQGMWDLSSSTRNQTFTSCIGSLNHWTTREVTGLLFYSSFICFLFYSPLWTFPKVYYSPLASLPNSCSLLLSRYRKSCFVWSMGKECFCCGQSPSFMTDLYDGWESLDSQYFPCHIFDFSLHTMYIPQDSWPWLDFTGNLWTWRLRSVSLTLKLYPPWGAAHTHSVAPSGPCRLISVPCRLICPLLSVTQHQH